MVNYDWNIDIVHVWVQYCTVAVWVLRCDSRLLLFQRISLPNATEQSVPFDRPDFNDLVFMQIELHHVRCNEQWGSATWRKCACIRFHRAADIPLTWNTFRQTAVEQWSERCISFSSFGSFGCINYMYLSVWKVPTLVPHADWLNRLVYLFVHLFVCLFVLLFLCMPVVCVRNEKRRTAVDNGAQAHSNRRGSTWKLWKSNRSVSKRYYTPSSSFRLLPQSLSSRFSLELRSLLLCAGERKKNGITKTPIYVTTIKHTKNKQVSISLNSFNWFLCTYYFYVEYVDVCNCGSPVAGYLPVASFASSLVSGSESIFTYQSIVYPDVNRASYACTTTAT